MPIEFWKSISKGRETGLWYWTAFGVNGEIVADSAEPYSSKAKAQQGATAAAKEFAKWQREQSKKPLKTATSGRRKPDAKPSTSSSKLTRRTGQRGG